MKCVKNIRTMNGFRHNKTLNCFERSRAKGDLRKNVLTCSLERLKERLQIHLGIGE